MTNHPWDVFEEHNRHFPDKLSVDFNNEIVGFVSSPDENYFNVIMKDGVRSKFNFNNKRAVEGRFDDAPYRNGNVDECLVDSHRCVDPYD